MQIAQDTFGCFKVVRLSDGAVLMAGISYAEAEGFIRRRATAMR